MRLRLGKLNFVHDLRDLKFRSYLHGSLPAAPNDFGHERILAADDWDLFGNGPDDEVALGFDGCGDCVFAGAAHETMLWTSAGSTMAVFNSSDVVADYSAVTGYLLGRADTDIGTDVREALKYRQQVGILDAFGERHRIGAFARLSLGSMDEVRSALWIFGVVGIGLRFPDPEQAERDFDLGISWTYTAGAPGDAGHYVPLVSSRDGTLLCVTWGRTQQLSQGFVGKYCDEAWVMLSEEMLLGGRSLEGFDLEALRADLARIE